LALGCGHQVLTWFTRTAWYSCCCAVHKKIPFWHSCVALK
jgi:hypothetical protein